MCFKYGILLVLYMFIVQVHSRKYLKGCTLNTTNTGKEKSPPLLFYNHTTFFELAIPSKGVVSLSSGDRITLACPGPRNYLNTTSSNSTLATCISGTTLKIFRKKIDFDDVQCRKDIRGEVRKTTTRCAEGKAHITEIGYQITKNDWFTLIKVCYDDASGLTLYTDHVLHGSALKYSTRVWKRPSFSTDGLGQGIAASVAYTQVFQKATFNALFVSAYDASFYLNDNSYLARGHLSPSADFVQATSKRSTFYLINTTPQWQVINGANWKSVETSIRKTAERYNRIFRIITGTHGTLSLPDSNGNIKSIYLASGNKFPVPKALWKIVYDQEIHMGIAIVVMNNPFAGAFLQKHLLCNDICTQNGWGTMNWKNTSRGFAYCCNLREFLEKVPIVPRLKVRGILQGPNYP